MLTSKLMVSIGAAAAVLLLATAALAATDVLVAQPELTVTRGDGNELCAMPGSDYADLVIDDQHASFTLLGQALPAGSKLVRGAGIRRVSWEPSADATLVDIEFSRPPSYHLINAVAGTEDRPQTPQVLAGFGFEPNGADQRARPILGGSQAGGSHQPDEYGTYKLPEFPPVKYSDALITLDVRNTDFRDVLWLMSQIGNVSIVLDPYWADEPTGGPRTPGGGADPGSGGGGGGEPGFRPGDEFLPQVPREGTGRLTLSFKNVPFDTALELVLMSVGLYKVDIYPGSLD